MGRKSKRKSKPGQDLKTLLEEPKPSPSRPMPIAERLGLAAYHGDDPDDGDEEAELQLDFRPRAYFVSGLCYVCSQPGQPGLTCEDCRMLSYCSAQHRQQSLKQHRQLCAVLGEICLRGKGLSLGRGLGADEYRGFRLELLRIVEAALGRRLELSERELLLYPRLCRVCHGSEDLRACSHCLMEHFCGDHSEGHEQHCGEFRVFRGILAMQGGSGFAAPRIPDFLVAEGQELPDNFDELIKEVWAFGCDYEKIDCASYAALSQAASPALTTFYALRNTQLCSQNVVSTEASRG